MTFLLGGHSKGKLESTGTLPWIERELEVKYMDVGYAPQHEPFDKSYAESLS